MSGTLRSAMRPLSLSCHVIRPIKPLPCSAEELQGREVLPAGLKWHTGALRGNSSRCCSITTTGWRDLWGFVATPLLYHWLPQWASLIKIHFGNNFVEIWKDSQASLTWRIRSPVSFIAKFLIEREASLKGTLPGSSHPDPQRSFPSFAGQHYSFVFGLNSRRCLRDFHFLITW